MSLDGMQAESSSTNAHPDAVTTTPVNASIDVTDVTDPAPTLTPGLDSKKAQAVTSAPAPDQQPPAAKKKNGCVLF